MYNDLENQGKAAVYCEIIRRENKEGFIHLVGKDIVSVRDAMDVMKSDPMKSIFKKKTVTYFNIGYRVIRDVYHVHSLQN